MKKDRAVTLSRVAFWCGIIAILCAVLPPMFLLLPEFFLGIAAIVCGVIARRKGGPSERAAVGIALGIAGVLLVPTIVLVADEAENYGRDCGAHPEWENC